jgi:membrane-associated PAP2 superfamily phosphatase
MNTDQAIRPRTVQHNKLGVHGFRPSPPTRLGRNDRDGKIFPSVSQSAKPKAMDRTGLALALAVAGVTAWLFTLFPQLDVAIAGLFYDSAAKDFTARFDPLLAVLRDMISWIVALLVAPAVIALALKLARPASRMIVPGRAAIFLIATLILGPGLLVNVTLKDNWGRPRPAQITAFNGSEPFVPWWDPRGTCAKNCSFVAGESSGAFWTLAPAALAPPQWRPVAYTAALAFGFFAGLLRMAFGGHFFTDVVFAGVFMFALIWTMHGVIYRWPRTRLSDAQVESALARFTYAVRETASALIARASAAMRQLTRRA